MARLAVKSKENPKLQQSTLSDGRVSLYLEYYLGRTQWVDEVTGKTKIKHDRKKVYLNLYLIDKPRTPLERETNRATLELAKSIRAEREQQFKNDRTGKRLKIDTKKINLLDFMQAYADGYDKKDIRMITGVIQRFKDFLATEYPMHSHTLKPEQLTPEMVAKFATYLEGRSIGEGARGYFQRFKKIIKYAIDKDLITKDPCTRITCKVDEQLLRKDILSMDEITQLMQCTYQGQNDNVRRAFIFCLYTGMRYCDIVDLKYKNIDFANRTLTFEQSKTKGHSSSSGVVIPLSKAHFTIIGGRGAKDEVVFPLPTHTMCLKALRRWTARAGIEKHITWHCARHSFAVNILNNGANIKTVASLLGHSGLKHTEKYTRAVDSLKKVAIDSLPEIKL